MKAQAISLPRLRGSFLSELRSAGALRARLSIWKRIATWNRVARERRRLLELDAHILKDIGLTQDEAYRESMRPFWDVDDQR